MYSRVYCATFTGYLSWSVFVDLATLPRWVMFFSALALAIFILCWAVADMVGQPAGAAARSAK